MDGSCLEIGCGPGGLLPTLSDHADIVAGLDISEDVIQDAAALTRTVCGASCVVRGNAYFLPFKDVCFDGIVCIETLEHLESKPLFDEILRILKPGGKTRF